MSSGPGYTTPEAIVLGGSGLLAVLAPMLFVLSQRERRPRVSEMLVVTIMTGLLVALVVGITMSSHADRLGRQRATALLQSRYGIAHPVLDQRDQTVSWKDAQGSCSASTVAHKARVDVLAGTVSCDSNGVALSKEQLAAEVASVRTFMQSVTKAP